MAFEKTRKKLAEAVKKARLKKAYKKEGMDKKAAKAKAKVKSKAPETGKVRRGAKGVESTKGGEYVKYKKKSKAAKSFRSEFAAARKAGKKSFSWDGRSYSTARADDKKKAAPKKDVKKAPNIISTIVKNLAKAKADRSASKKSDDLQNPPNLKIKKASKPSKPDVDLQPSEQAKNKAKESKDKKPTYEELSKNVSTKKMEAGGKVESNPYGWPSSDSRNR